MAVLAPRYMERFRCIGAACEDTCCRGWRVTIDRKSFDALADAMGGSARGQGEFARKVRRLPVVDATDMAFATAERDDAGQCLFVRDDGLCSVQARFGHEVLSNTCALFPRQVRVSPAAVELTGLPSCPEAARQLLLHEDAMELVELPAEVLERQLAHERTDGGDYYAAYLDDVREAMLGLARLRGFSLAERLFFMAFFARKTQSFFHRGVSDDPGPALAKTLDRLAAPGVLDAISVELGRVDVPAGVVATLASEIGLVGRPVSPSFAALVERVFATFEACRPGRESGDAGDLDAQRLASLHRARQARLRAVAGERVDAMIERFVLNYWVQRWYTASPDLLHHVRDLLIEIAVQQLLLSSHPEVLDALDGADASPDALPDGVADAVARAIDRAAVETVSRTSRCIEHTSLRSMVGERLASLGLPTFAYATCLIEFAVGREAMGRRTRVRATG